MWRGLRGDEIDDFFLGVIFLERAYVMIWQDYECM